MWPVLFASLSLSLLYGLVLVLLRLLHPEWWRLAAVRRVVRVLPVVALVGMAGWFLPILLDARPAARFGATIVTLVVMALFALLVSLPFSGVLAGIVRLARLLGRRSPRATGGAGLARRDLLIHATAALPAAALAVAGVGVVSGFRPARVHRVPIAVPDLAPGLGGLKILQLTDIHLGTFVSLGAFERVLEDCAAARPDLCLVTGDACDDMGSLRDLLALIASLRPPLGTYGSLGNHEYYRGVAAFRRAYDRAGLPLLVSEGLRVRTAGGSLWIGAADDPAIMGASMADFLDRSVERAVRDRHAGEPSLLLSHRPDGFEAAARHGVSLTLSGHTHGGQVGWSGRSVFEPLFPRWYLRGQYRRDGSVLYTSTGFGHWFPFRLGCPAEAPLLVLEPARAV